MATTPIPPKTTSAVNSRNQFDSIEMMAERQRMDAAHMQALLRQAATRANQSSGAGEWVVAPNSIGGGLGISIGGGAGGNSGMIGGFNPYMENDRQLLLSENAVLKEHVMHLERALRNPDLPLAQSAKQLVETIDPKEIMGRTTPPFTDANISARVMHNGLPMGEGFHHIPMRGGGSSKIRIVGMIVREENGSPKAVPTTYMIPSAKMTDGDAYEAIADLIADIVMRRVIKQMGENDEPDAKQGG
ncbi:MAG: hypothetical protein QM805_07840 [Pseudomonas sp.]